MSKRTCLLVDVSFGAQSPKIRKLFLAFSLIDGSSVNPYHKPPPVWIIGIMPKFLTVMADSYDMGRIRTMLYMQANTCDFGT
jgi:hypothetical protein